MNQRYYDKVPYKYFDILAKLWPVIISIIVVTVAYGVTRNTVEEDHAAIKELSVKVITEEAHYAEIKDLLTDLRDGQKAIWKEIRK